MGGIEQTNEYPLIRPQSAIERPCHVHSGELEAEKATEGKSLRGFQSRPAGFKLRNPKGLAECYNLTPKSLRENLC